MYKIVKADNEAGMANKRRGNEMADMDKRYENDSYYSEIALDDLEAISGGRVRTAGYASVLAAMRILKKQGKTKEYARQMIIDSWNEGCPFKEKFTDGLDEDLENTLAFIDRNW